MELKILGIAAPHRKGRRNTIAMLEEALKGAETIKGVQTDLINLREKDIKYCVACDACVGRGKAWGRGDVREDLKGCTVKDDMQELYEIFFSDTIDGIIFASPVHILGVSSRLKVFIDRMRPVVHQGSLRWTVGAVLSVAYLSIGGQEYCNIDIDNAFKALGIIRVGHGATGVSGPAAGGPVPWNDHVPRTDVLNDRFGIITARMEGRNVAEVAKIVKIGRQNIDPAEFETFIKSYHQFPNIKTD